MTNPTFAVAVGAVTESTTGIVKRDSGSTQHERDFQTVALVVVWSAAHATRMLQEASFDGTKFRDG
jgi:hypothetical protein